MRWVFYLIGVIAAYAWGWITHILELLRGWRTLIFNVIASVMPILELTEVAAVMPEAWLNWYLLAVAVINMWLRSATTTPLGHAT